MFEIKDGQEYNNYGGINKDPFTWKIYPVNENNLVMNKHGMLEVQVNLTETVLKGSG